MKPKVDSKWFKFDDDRVVPVSEKEVYEDNFGGDATGNNLLSRQHRMQKRFTNAYMLVYIRESDIPNILSDVTAADIPDHLAENLEKERVERGRLYKEQQERHLFLKTLLLRDEDITKRPGFDLWNFEFGQNDQLLTIKARRDQKWLDYRVLCRMSQEYSPV